MKHKMVYLPEINLSLLCWKRVVLRRTHSFLYLCVFSRTGHSFDWRDKLSPVFQHGFLRSEENVFPAIFEHHQRCMRKCFSTIFSILMYDRCYYHTCIRSYCCLGWCYCLCIVAFLFELADVWPTYYMIYDRCWLMFIAILWWMLTTL